MFRNFLQAAIVFFLFLMPVKADANILITPTQIVFNDRERFADIFLANNSDEPKSYELSWQLFKMVEETGLYSREKFVPEYDLSEMIRFAPRRVTLPPLGKQKVRLSFRRAPDIKDGDYHIHLKFKLIPGEYKPELDKPIEKALVHVPINIHYTIPIIVRIGEPSVNVSIGQIDLERDQTTGKITMNLPVAREGQNFGVYGHIRVYHLKGNGEEVQIGEVSNANIFPEITKRTFNVPFEAEISGGRLRVEIRNYDKENDFVIAEKVFDLQ